MPSPFRNSHFLKNFWRISESLYTYFHRFLATYLRFDPHPLETLDYRAYFKVKSDIFWRFSDLMTWSLTDFIIFQKSEIRKKSENLHPWFLLSLFTMRIHMRLKGIKLEYNWSVTSPCLPYPSKWFPVWPRGGLHLRQVVLLNSKYWEKIMKSQRLREEGCAGSRRDRVWVWLVVPPAENQHNPTQVTWSQSRLGKIN